MRDQKNLTFGAETWEEIEPLSRQGGSLLLSNGPDRDFSLSRRLSGPGWVSVPWFPRLLRKALS